MSVTDWTVICCAYIFGLLLTAIPGQMGGIAGGAIAALGMGVGLAVLLPRFWRIGTTVTVWLLAGIVACLAVFYFEWTLPQPSANDISHLLQNRSAVEAPILEVEGAIATAPRLTRSQRLQFQLQVEQLRSSEATPPSKPPASEKVTGLLYVTVPLLQGTGLYPGQTVAITGSLYQPKPATNPGGFDFQAYLAQQGIFAGMKGKKVMLVEREQSQFFPGRLLERVGQVQFWVQQRIVRSQVEGAGIPAGPLISAMVMGRNGVDLDYDLRDQFSRCGLAHALAASGFQVSLLMGAVVALSGSLSRRMQLGLGIGVIVAYVGLTGIQAAVMRAAIMGVATLVAMTAERKVKPLGSLLAAATVLLLYNPRWIWDLGFQFSFLATLGLLVTVPTLTRWLDWLPTAIAPMIAVPLAASLWTFPLQLYVFGVVSPYSIAINVITTPLITIISLGGIVSAFVALIYPPAGSLIAGILSYPTQGLIGLAEVGNRLPGSGISVGTIALTQLLVLYGLIGVIWWRSPWWRYWWMAVIIGISVIGIPAGHRYWTRSQVTILATATEPVMVMQQQGNVILLNSGDDANAYFTVLPFLRQQGINRLDWAIAPDFQKGNATGWFRILTDLPVHTFYGDAAFGKAEFINAEFTAPKDSPAQSAELQAIKNAYRPVFNHLASQHHPYLPLTPNQAIALGSTQIQLLHTDPVVLQFKLADQQWLFLQKVNPRLQQQFVQNHSLPQANLVWWTGEELLPELLQQVKPQVAIASARSVPPKTAQWLQQHSINAYATGEDGALQWTETGAWVARMKTADLEGLATRAD